MKKNNFKVVRIDKNNSQSRDSSIISCYLRKDNIFIAIKFVFIN